LADPPSEFDGLPLKNPPGTGYEDPVEIHATELMTAAKHGDRAAFDDLTRALRGRAYSVARSLVGSRDDALDLCQEAFLKTYRARETYREGEPFLPWFHRILRNTCFSFLRKHGRIKAASLSVGREEDGGDWEIESEDAPPSAGAESSEAVEAFVGAFHRLSSRDREILSLRHFEDLSYREIASALEIPEGTVMSRLFHARRRLRAELRHHLEDAPEGFAAALLARGTSDRAR
jgi:RNA polymerase sigma-70 factor (ECF subfamily)